MKFLDQVKILLKLAVVLASKFQREWLIWGRLTGKDYTLNQKKSKYTIDYRYQQHFKAKKGERQDKIGQDLGGKTNFKSSNRTQIFEGSKNTKNMLLQLVVKWFRNTRFKSSTNRAPRNWRKEFWI